MAQHTTQSTNAAEKTTGNRGAYLPVLPDGWEYEVRLSGPEGQVHVSPRLDRTDAFAAYVVKVEAKADDGIRRPRFERPTLAEAVREAAKAVKAVVRVGKHEAEARAARQALLDQIGDDPAEPEDGDESNGKGVETLADSAKGVYPGSK